ncbi:MAG: hypothetical protein QOD98_2633 [Nocardioidaceae bacterium]|nr:hypothetical protein [Nocardioidaceae bacterium]
MADHRHKRDTEARRKPKAQAIIGPLAVLATASVVTIGVLGAGPAASDLAPLAIPTPLAASADRSDDPITRSENRVKATASRDLPPPAFMSKASITAAIKAAKKQQWTTDDLNIWNQPGDKARQLGELAAGKKVVVTGREMWGRTEIVLKGESRWVTDGYLSDDKPLAAAAGLSMEPCPDGSVENGLTDGAVYVYRSVCHAFPQITSYGGWSNHGEHSSGKALDIMTSDVELGTAIAEFLQSHASELHLFDVIWRQHIWTPVRASEGWRMMPSRGSATANHYDHVHVSVY